MRDGFARDMPRPIHTETAEITRRQTGGSGGSTGGRRRRAHTLPSRTSTRRKLWKVCGDFPSNSSHALGKGHLST